MGAQIKATPELLFFLRNANYESALKLLIFQAFAKSRAHAS